MTNLSEEENYFKSETISNDNEDSMKKTQNLIPSDLFNDDENNLKDLKDEKEDIENKEINFNKINSFGEKIISYDNNSYSNSKIYDLNNTLKNNISQELSNNYTYSHSNSFNINNSLMNNHQNFFENIINLNQINSFNNDINNFNLINFNNNPGFYPFHNSHSNININNKSTKNNNTEKKIKIKKDNILLISENYLYNNLLTQNGSEKIQKIIKNLKTHEIDIFLNKIQIYFFDIMVNKYGNYFIGELFQICTFEQRLKIIKKLEGHFTELAIDKYGTFPLQRLMEIINISEEKNLITKYIIGNEQLLAFDKNGSHVLQKFLGNSKDEDRGDIDINLIKIVNKLIINMLGAGVLVKLIKHTNNKENLIKIINYINNNEPIIFMQHPYSNYVIQSLIINPISLPFCDLIIKTIINNYLSLSLQKNSTKVVENCINYCNYNIIKRIYNSIIEEKALDTLLNNYYGNFVLLQLIKRLNDNDKNFLIKKIEKFGKNKIINNYLKSSI